MNILHLSDLHFRADTDTSGNGYGPLAEDLKTELECEQLDAVILSGDIASYSTQEEYKNAKQFLHQVCEEFDLDFEHVVIVPGNHDLNWTLSKEAYELKRREQYQGPMDTDHVIDNDKLVEVRNDKKYQRRFQHFSAFYQDIKGKPYPAEYAEQAVLHHFSEKKLLILGLNSAWKLDYHYTSRAGIHPDTINKALTQIRKNSKLYQDCIKLAVWHHPIASASNDRITDTGFLEQLAKAGFRIGLHGHIHKADANLYCYDQSVGGRQLDIICAGTFGAPMREWVPGYPLQYNLLRLTKDDRLVVDTRRREQINGAWKPDARWLQGSGQDPRSRYEIILSGSGKPEEKQAEKKDGKKLFVSDPHGNPNDGKKFFISYPHGNPDEENLACFLQTRLIRAGHEVFIDMRTKTGRDWVTEIHKQISRCDYLLVLLSENAMNSETLPTEVRIAHLLQGQPGSPRILPVRLRYFGALEYELDLYLGHLPYIAWQGPSESERVLREIRDVHLHVADSMKPPAATDRLKTSEAHKPAKKTDHPQSTPDLRAVSMQGGLLRYDDPFYIMRPADKEIKELAPLNGKTLVIKGPRQMGKTSLLVHYLSQCQQVGKKIALVDFSIFSSEDLSDYPTFLSRLAMVLQYRLEIEGPEEPRINSQLDMVRFMEQHLLASVGTPVVIAFDEVDRVFRQKYQVNFFTMLRFWHNNRSPFSPQWETFDLALVVSTEPYLLIDKDDRSPFNVGRVLDLGSFTWEQCCELNKRHGAVLASPEIKELWDLLRGHPYLTRLALYHLVAANRMTFRQLMEKAIEERGPFDDHLRALLVKLHGNPELLDGMKQVIRTGAISNEDLYYRFYGAGLVRQEGTRINPANLLYARYFKQAL
ncbi:MAG: TIR domain-containing protein [Gammaproteobacteria bacterium]|nr:TIR domain-containing protein [Gammaproteobacteria bacterium]